MSKLTDYVGWWSVLRARVGEVWAGMLERRRGADGVNGPTSELDRETNFRIKVKEKLERLKVETIRKINSSATDSQEQEDFSHITRPKTRLELVKVSAAVMGIEFSYAAETAFVSPLLLNIGLRHRHMTLIWCLSPILGLFITPLLGSLSDGCKSRLGRRRPFIILLSIGIVLGLILVPNGKTIGLWLGDTYTTAGNGNSGNKDLAGIKPSTELPVDATANTLLANLSLSQTKFQDTSNKSWTSTSSSTNKPIWEETNTSSSRQPNSNSPVLSYKTSSSKLSSSILAALLSDDGNVKPHSNQLDKSPIDDSTILTEFVKARKGSKNKLTQKRLDELLNDEMWEAEAGTQEATTVTVTELSGNETRATGFKDTTTMTSPKTTVNLGHSSTDDTDEIKKEEKESEDEMMAIKQHPWGLFVTVIGTVLLDFDADACQSPSRAYMLDVTIPDDHARGLSTFTIMAGLGGSLGYFLGALNWENTFLGAWFGGHVRAVFTLVLFLFIACVVTTIRSFREIPTNRVGKKSAAQVSGGGGAYSRFEDELEPGKSNYGTLHHNAETSFTEIIQGNDASSLPPVNPSTTATSETPPTAREYLQTILQLPKSLQWLCLTNFFSWMSLVCYSLYFTDFVGEAVFGGDPAAPIGSEKRSLYEDGVRFGCWGMSIYSLSCSLYSYIIERLIRRFGAKRTYITGQLVYSVGMVCMTLARSPAGVIIFSWTAGIMYSTLFTMPYLLVARYHASETFDIDSDDLIERPSQLPRGLGTDVAVVSSMVFLAQITQSVTLGSVVTFAGTTTAIILAAALFAALGALSATRVLYLDL